MISEPDITVVELSGNTDEALLLCCDGLVERLTNEQLAQYVAQECRKTPNDPACNTTKETQSHTTQKQHNTTQKQHNNTHKTMKDTHHAPSKKANATQRQHPQASKSNTSNSITFVLTTLPKTPAATSVSAVITRGCINTADKAGWNWS